MATQLYPWFNYIYYTLGLICPAVSLFRSLLITLNVYSLACKGRSNGPNPGAISMYGGPILYLTLQFVVLVIFLVFWESGRSLEVFGIPSRRRQNIVEELSAGNNADAREDEKHLEQSHDGLRLHNITKSFGPNRAVDNVSFGILPSEKMALLGGSLSPSSS